MPDFSKARLSDMLRYVTICNDMYLPYRYVFTIVNLRVFWFVEGVNLRVFWFVIFGAEVYFSESTIPQLSNTNSYPHPLLMLVLVNNVLALGVVSYGRICLWVMFISNV